MDEARELVDEERDRDLPGVFFGDGARPVVGGFLGVFLRRTWDHWSNEKKPGWLGYIGDFATQLFRDYNKPL